MMKYNEILEKQRELLMKNNIIVLVDYEYECTSDSYFYKIYKIIEHGEPEKWPIRGIRSDGDKEIEEIVAWRDYKKSYQNYETYLDALSAGIIEGFSMIDINANQLTWQDIRKIVKIADNMVDLDCMGNLPEHCETEEGYYKEVLKRFNDDKKIH